MRNNLNVFTYSYLPWKYIRNIPKNIAQFFRNIKYAWQRAIKGYCDQDLWGLDYYYSELFYVTLKELNEIKHGYPAELSDEEWTSILNEMAEHFLNTQEWNDELPVNQEVMQRFEEMRGHIIDTKEHEEINEQLGKLYRIEEIYDDKVEYERAQRKWLAAEKRAWKFREEEKNKAFKMLSKYFFGLWD